MKVRPVPLITKLLALITLLHAGVALSGDEQPGLEAYLRASKSFTAQFNQQVINVTHDKIEDSSGHMSFMRPGKFRWVYEQPYEQEIISDGETLWIYDKDLEQVSIRPVSKGLNRTPIMLLDDPANISQEFNVESLSDVLDKAIFRLTPKHEDAGFQSVTLVFEGEVLIGMNIYDNFDQTSNLSFRDIQRNRELADMEFHFEPPEGVDVIHASEQLN